MRGDKNALNDVGGRVEFSLFGVKAVKCCALLSGLVRPCPSVNLLR